MREPTIELSPAATAFIRAHTTVDVEVPHDEECSICLENYREELCVRIKDVGGCTCRIGQVCLGELLSMQPLKQKKCPLCRTVWIAGQTPAVPSVSVFRPSSLLNARHTATGTSDSRQRGLSVTATPFVPDRPNPITVIDRDAGHAAGQDGFNRQAEEAYLTRAFQDIRARTRARARNMQLSGSRQRELARSQSARQRAIGRDAHNQDAPTARTGERIALDLENVIRAHLYLDPSPGSSRSLRPQASQAEPAARSSLQAGPVSSAQAFDRPHQTSPTAHTPFVLSRRTSDGRATNRSDDDATINIVKPASPTSTTDDTCRNNVHTTILKHREEAINAREAALIERETRLIKRKRELETRGSELNKRAKSVHEHEAIAARKEKDRGANVDLAEAKIRTLQRQKDEMKNVMRRHQYEMEKLMKRLQDDMKRF